MNPTSGKARGKTKPRVQLELVPRNLAEMPLTLMYHLSTLKDPFDLEVSQRDRAQAREAGLTLPEYRRRHLWPTKETVVNRSLDAVLLAMPPSSIGTTLTRIANTCGLANAIPYKLRIPKKLLPITGAPDFVLWDKERSALLLGEIKIGATSSNGRYSDQQLKKYMRLGLILRARFGIEHVSHLIVLPSPDIRQHCQNADYWQPDVVDGRLVERANRFMTIYSEYLTLVTEAAKIIGPIDLGRVRSALRKDNPLIPLDTFVTSWADLCEAMWEVCSSPGSSHLLPAIEQLRALGEGRYNSIDR